MKYIHIPVEFSHPTEADFASFCMAVDDFKDHMLHVHCIANLRVTAFFYRYQRDVLEMGEEASRALMDSVWRPGGVWAEFIGDTASVGLEHRPPA